MGQDALLVSNLVSHCCHLPGLQCRGETQRQTPGFSFLYGLDSRSPVRGTDVGAGGRRGAARHVGRWEVAGGLGASQPLPSLLQTVTTGGKFPETFQNSFLTSL